MAERPVPMGRDGRRTESPMLMIELVASTMIVLVVLGVFVVFGARGLERLAAATHARVARVEADRLDDELREITD